MLQSRRTAVNQWTISAFENNLVAGQRKRERLGSL